MIKSKFLAVGLAAALCAGFSMQAQSSKYEDGVQCAAMLRTMTKSWTESHPNWGDAKALETGWVDYSLALSGASPEKVDTDIATSANEIETYVISVKGDPVAMQNFMKPISDRCNTTPQMPVPGGICHALASGEKSASELSYDMHQYNLAFVSEAEQAGTRRAMAQDQKRAADAQTVLEYYEDAPKPSATELLELLELTPEQRSAQVDQCIAQIH